MEIIVAGGREFSNYSLLEETLDKIIQQPEQTLLISGGARGADALGERYAHTKNISVVRCPADWKRYRKGAGERRNREMARQAAEDDQGALVAFWDGKSRGTGKMIELAKQHGLKIYIVSY